MACFNIGDKVIGVIGSHKDDIGEIVGYGGYKFQEQNYMVQFHNRNEPYECTGSSLDPLDYVKSKMNKNN